MEETLKVQPALYKSLLLACILKECGVMPSNVDLGLTDDQAVLIDKYLDSAPEELAEAFIAQAVDELKALVPDLLVLAEKQEELENE